MNYQLPPEYIKLLTEGETPVRSLDKMFGIDKNLSPLLRSVAGFKVSRHQAVTERYAQIKPLLSSGMTQRAIASKLSCSVGTIQKVIKSYRAT